MARSEEHPAGVEPIAIVGMSCRLPGDASDPEKLWRLLQEGRSAWSEFPADRLNKAGFVDSKSTRPGTTNTGGGHFLKGDISEFDAAFFGINPKEASAIDPQQRLLLELAYEAFDSCGLTNEDLWGSDTGVFVGQWASDYNEILSRDTNLQATYQTTGTGPAISSNRISYYFNLKGPSFTVDTGCSSSMVALHQAVQSLRSGESNQSFVGGVNALLDPQRFTYMSRLKMFSDEGRSFPFDDRADGYGRGEGCTGLVLMRLSTALQERRPIRAVIRNSAINQDGRTFGISVPSGPAQTAAIRQAYSQAGLGPDVDYVEAHGTGTRVGDPIEAKAIAAALSQHRSSSDPLPIGSIKGNIGHLESAAGLAGLIKSVLMLEKGMIPPQANFKAPNPVIGLERLKLRVPQKLEKHDLRRISVNCFGYGGTNAHVILERAANFISNGVIESEKPALNGAASSEHEAHTNGVNGIDECEKKPQLNGLNGVNGTNGSEEKPQLNGSNGHDSTKTQTNGTTSTEESSPKQPRLFLLSAGTESSLQTAASNLAAYLATKSQSTDADSLMRQVAYSLSRKSRFDYRAAIVASELDDLIAQLEQASKQPAHQSKLKGNARVAFIFSGQGAQYAGMGRELLNTWPAFTESMARAGRCLAKLGCDWDLVEELMKSSESSRVDQPEIAQPLSTAIQLALVDALAGLDVVPNAVTGHSSGEIAAAYCAKALSFEDAMLVAYHRGRLSGELSKREDGRTGAMLAVGAAPEFVDEEIQSLGEAASRMRIACFNSPQSVTVSGDADAIDVLEAALKKKDTFNRKLRTGGLAYHSHHMLDIQEAYAASMATVKGKKTDPSVTMVSSLTGSETKDLIIDSSYWVKNLVSPVKFAEASKVLCQAKSASKRIDLLLEIGPHFQLGGAIKQTLRSLRGDASKKPYTGTLKRGQPADFSMFQTLGSLFLGQVAARFQLANNAFDERMPELLSDLPAYSFDHSRKFWHESRISKAYREREFLPHDLLGTRSHGFNGVEPRWVRYLRLDELPWLRGHVVQGQVVFPAAGYIAMAVQAIKEQFLQQDSKAQIETFELRNISFGQALILNEGVEDLEVELALRPQALSARRSSTKWTEFRIFTVTRNNKWVEHCRGLAGAELGTGDEQTDKDLVSDEDLKLYDQIQQSGRSIDRKKFYFMSKDCGLNWSDPFDKLSVIRTVPGACVAKATPVDTALNSPGSQGRPYVIHPTVLDACLFHSLYAVRIFEDDLMEAVVPTFIKRLSVSGRYPDISTKELSCYAQKTTSSLTYNTKVFDRQASPARVIIEASGVSATRLPGALPMAGPPRHLTHAVDWVTDMDLATPEVITQICTKDIQHGSAKEINERGDAMALNYIQNALKEVSLEDVPDGYLRHWYAWMQTLKTATYDTRLIEGGMFAGDDNVAFEALGRLGPRLPELLRGSIHPLTLMRDDDLLNKIYVEERNLRCYAQIAAFCKAYGRQHPTMKVLEIGAGTASVALPVLQALKDSGRSLASQYDFTDISAGFFPSAKELLAEFGSVVNYRVLDAEKDPLEQGFSVDTYDLVIASNVIHATSSISVVLNNVRSFLRPGGTFILMELTADAPLYNIIYGAFPGWWAGYDDGRTLSPLLTVEKWTSALETAGFEVPEKPLQDYELEDGGTLSVFLARAKDAPRLTDQLPIEIVTTGSDDLLQHSLAKTLPSHLPGRDVDRSDLLAPTTSEKLLIFPPSVSQVLATSTQKEEWEALKDRIIASRAALFIYDEDSTTSDRPLAAVISGFCRTLRLEHPQARFVTLQTSRGSSFEIKASVIATILQSPAFDLQLPGPEVEADFLEKDGRLYVSRLVAEQEIGSYVHDMTGSSVPVEAPFAAQERVLTAELGVQGLYETMRWTDDEEAKAPLHANFVKLRLCSASINFKDVLIASGQLEGITQMQNDCSGVVVEVGANMRGRYKPGDRVCSLYSKAYTNFPIVHGDCIHTIPDSLSFEEAASLPIVWSTVYYSLVDVGRLRQGDSVLIHSAAGGVGQAAIMLAKYLGAEIFATVGNDDKRRYLVEKYGLKNDHIFSSRSTTFSDGVRKMTNGRGVDVVLNSLSGEMFRESCNVVAPFGRFVEIGRKELMEDAMMPMEYLLKNITFGYVDMALVIREAPRLAQRVLHDVVNLIGAGAIRAVPITTMPISEIESAFRIVQGGKLIGKLILTVSPEDKVKIIPARPPPVQFRPNAAYIVVGGLGGLGKRIINWLSGHGAKNIITVSRSGSKDSEAAALVEKLKAKGTSLHIRDADISSREDVQKIVREAERDFSSIGGVIQAAMVLRDTVFEEMNFDEWKTATRPKIEGSWNLHAELPHTIDFFIMLSSVVSVRGNAGQSNYAAGCSFQDELAHYRTTRGLPGHAVNVGMILEEGYVSENLEVANMLRKQGFGSVSIEQLLAHLGKVIADPPTGPGKSQSTIGFIPTGLESDCSTIVGLNHMKFNHLHGKSLASAQMSDASADILAGLRSVGNASEAVEVVCHAILESLSKMIDLPVDQFNAANSLDSYGVDSLVAVELRNWIGTYLQADVPLLDLKATGSIQELAEMATTKSRLVEATFKSKA